MEKGKKLKELLAANPSAREHASRVEEAMALVRQMRSFGLPEKGYELATPFGDKEWLRTMKVAACKN